MREKIIKLYTYSELSDEAKEKARDWMRNIVARSPDTFFAESVIDDFVEVAKACGFTLRPKRGSRATQAVYWDGFSHQGSGASFDASWSAADVDVAAMLANRPATYTDMDGMIRESKCNVRLRSVLEDFASFAKDHPDGSGRAEAAGHYHGMRCELDDESPHPGEQNTFQELCTDLAHWLYTTLGAEYEYQLSDDVIAESLEANNYEFTEDGSPS